MINRRFLYFKRESDFLLKKNDILNDSIVFIEDEHYIWTHGEKYICSGSDSAVVEGGTLTFKDGAQNVKFTITLDGSNLIIRDSEGNESSVKYALEKNVNANLNTIKTSLYNFKKDTTDELNNRVKISDFQASLDTKVNKVNGKGLSTNDFTNALLNKLNILKNPTIDSRLDLTSENAVQNKIVTAALGNKADKTTFDDYSTTQQVKNLLKKKQDTLLAGWGIDITNNVVSSKLDIEPYVIVSSIEDVINPSPNKIYLQLTIVDDQYHYDQYKYIDNQWRFIGSATPDINLTGYLLSAQAEELYQPKGDYLESSDLNSYATKGYVESAIREFSSTIIEDTTEYAPIGMLLNYQPIGDYASKDWVNDYYVEHDDVYTIYGVLTPGNDVHQTFNPTTPSLPSGTGDTIIYRYPDIDTQLSVTSTNPVLNKVITKAIRDIKNITVDSELNVSSLNPVENRAIYLALLNKANTSELSKYALSSALDDKANVTDLGAYITRNAAIQALNHKQNILTPGLGITIVDDVISADLDTEVFVIVDQLPTTNISENKIYLTKSTVNGNTTYIEWKYNATTHAWTSIGERSPEISLDGYLTKQEALNTYLPKGTQFLTEIEASGLYQPIGRYATVDFTESTYQKKGSYATQSELSQYLLRSEFLDFAEQLTDYATKDWVIDYFVKLAQLYTVDGSTEVVPSPEEPTVVPSGGGGGGNSTTIVYNTVQVDTVLSSTSENPVQNKVIYNALRNIDRVVVDATISRDSSNPVENRAIAIALDSKANASALTQYATLTDIQDKVNRTELSDYATVQSLNTGLGSKQNTLTAGDGILIINNTISATLDTQAFVIVEDLSEVVTPSENKIYLKEEEENGQYTYIEYKWRDGSWERIGEKTPTVDLTPYLRIQDAASTYITENTADGRYQPKGDYQPVGNYLTVEDARSTYQPVGDYADQSEVNSRFSNYQLKGDYALNEDVDLLEYKVDQLYQRKGNYSTREEVNSALAALQLEIDEVYVKKIDVATPEDNEWSTGGYSSVSIPTEGGVVTPGTPGQGGSSNRMVTLTTTRYQELVDNDRVDPNTYYFTYEAEEETWGFGDTFPVILTDNNNSSEWTFPITLTDGSTPDSIGTFPINLV